MVVEMEIVKAFGPSKFLRLQFLRWGSRSSSCHPHDETDGLEEGGDHKCKGQLERDEVAGGVEIGSRCWCSGGAVHEFEEEDGVFENVGDEGNRTVCHY